MHEASLAQIQTDMRHFAGDLEEQDVASAQIVSLHCGCRGPELPGRSGHALADTGIGILHQTAAIETARATAAIAVRHTDLIQRDCGRFLADAGMSRSRASYRRWIPCCRRGR